MSTEDVTVTVELGEWAKGELQSLSNAVPVSHVLHFTNAAISHALTTNAVSGVTVALHSSTEVESTGGDAVVKSGDSSSTIEQIKR